MYDIVSLGELLVDFTFFGTSPAGMRLFEQNPGGAVTNLVCAAAKCGAKAAFIGKVGADMHGEFLKRAMEQAGVDMHGLVMDPDVFTTLAFVALGANGERTFSFARKPGADTQLNPWELDTGILQNTRIFHVGSLSLTDEPARSATFAAVSLSKQAGAIISYDPNYRSTLWRSQAEATKHMRSMIPFVDMMKISDEETRLLTDEEDPLKASLALCNQGVKVVAVTLGADGALVRCGQRAQLVKGFPSHVVDTTGAGDSFFGGFLFRYLQKNVPLSALTTEMAADMARFGNATASLCVEKRGGIPAMPALALIEERLDMK